jgi:hypothetical protein
MFEPMRFTISMAALLVVACRGTPRSSDEQRRDAAVQEVARDAGDGVQRKAVPCIPKAANVSLGLRDDDGRVGGHTAICWGGRCIELALAEDSATVVPPPGRPSAWIDPVTIHDDKGVKAACLGDKCTPLGPHLSEAVATQPADAAAVTTDRKLVVVGTEVWKIAADRKLELKPPVAAFGSDPAKIVQVAVAGAWLVVTWASTRCHDPTNWADPACGLFSQLVDSTGVNRGTELEFFSGGFVGQFDAGLFYTADRTVPDVRLLEISSGKLVWKLDHGVGFKILDTLRVQPGLLAILLRDGFVGYRLVDFTAGPGDPIRITTSRYLPFCED